jgi:hypothetical protein
MIALTVGAPFTLFGEGLFDLRFPVLAAGLLVAGLQLTASARASVPIAALIALFTVVHVAGVPENFVAPSDGSCFGCTGAEPNLRRQDLLFFDAVRSSTFGRRPHHPDGVGHF